MKFKSFLQEGKSVSILRVGGLSKVKYKNTGKMDSFFGDFHTPPVKKGYFAFLADYVEPFLYKWKYKSFEKLAKEKNIDVATMSDDEISALETEAKKKNKELEHNDRHRRLEYKGWLWCHFIEQAREYYKGNVEIKGSWVKVHSDDFEEIFKKVRIQDTKSIRKDRAECGLLNPVKDPYKRGRTGGMTMSRDHLEVFIP